ncbi:DUF6890 family protein [Xenorhabdus cabanillasii]|uniref:DUF6890 family protein n=1 Tax=Xenorhabdus cabanillasii TaxID=351673 RepID=UPI00352285FD
MENSLFEQALILRRHYLPNEPDNTESLARAIWLDNRYWDYMRVSTANGIALAFRGES